MMTNERSFWSLALDKAVAARALRVALIVGVVLAAINHGDRIVTGTLDASAIFKILLTFLVPYSVSTYSSVQAIRQRDQG